MYKFLKRKPIEDQVTGGSQNIPKNQELQLIWMILYHILDYVFKFFSMTQIIEIKYKKHIY